MLTLETSALALVLIVAVVLADHYPIHIRFATKVSMISVPLLMTCWLLPAPAAAGVAAVSIWIADTIARRDRGYRLIDLLGDAARWAGICALGSLLVHTAGMPIELLFLFSGVLLYLLDLLTFSISQSLVSREPVGGILRAGMKETAGIEAIQYLIAILGVLAYQQTPWALPLIFVPTAIAYVAFKNLKEMRRDTHVMLEAIADAVDQRDPYTAGHSRRVAEWVARITRQLQIDGPEADLMITAARLHDIGKLGIPDAVLHKQSILNPSEWNLVQDHALRGAEHLARYADFARGAEMIRYHHERWDGAGYPQGAKHFAIPLGARVIAVADAYDAMTTTRPYQQAISTEQAMRLLREGRSRQWDPQIVDALLACLDNSSTAPRPTVLQPHSAF